MDQSASPLRVPDLVAKKRAGEKIVMLTAYDATMARIIDRIGGDRAGVDAILVGDSLGNVILGQGNTLGVTLDMVVHHARAVSNGTRRAVVVADMPFLTYQTGVNDAVRNAGRLIQEGGAAAVKLEGGRANAEVVARLVEVGIPVMGHLGITPQSVHRQGGYRKLGAEIAETLIEEAHALEQAGVFAIVLEQIDAQAARAVTEAVSIPTIGIGAGPHCDGQVLVSYDAFGLFDEFTPSFVKRYAEIGREIERAARCYAEEVRAGRFPK